MSERAQRNGNRKRARHRDPGLAADDTGPLLSLADLLALSGGPEAVAHTQRTAEPAFREDRDEWRIEGPHP